MSQSLSTVAIEPLNDYHSIDDRSRNVLVLLTGTGVDHRLVCEAGAYAAGTASRLVVVSVMPMSEFTHRQRAYAGIRDLPPYALDQAEERQRGAAARIGREALTPLGIDYTAVGMVGRQVEMVLIAARAYDCGHIFLVDRQQSLLRRLVARNVAQSITRGFDGLVTVLQDEREKEVTIEPPTAAPV